MRKELAEQFLDNLATAFDYRLSLERRVYYLDALLDVAESAAQDAFNHLVLRSKRFPTVAEVSAAFEAHSDSSRDASRSRPMSAEARRRQEQALRAYLELEAVFYHADLYGGYVQALREHWAGRRTREALRAARRAAIEEARRRAEPAKNKPHQPPEQAPQTNTGIAASLPRGDRA